MKWAELIFYVPYPLAGARRRAPFGAGLFKAGRLSLFENGQTVTAFGYYIALGYCIDGVFFGFFAKVVDPLRTTILQCGVLRMQEIGTTFGISVCICHGMDPFLCPGLSWYDK